MKLLDDTRNSVFFLNYKNLKPENVNPYQPMGPNLQGEVLWPVEVIDEHTLGLSLVPPEGLDE